MLQDFLLVSQTTLLEEFSQGKKGIQPPHSVQEQHWIHSPLSQGDFALVIFFPPLSMLFSKIIFMLV